MNDNLNRLMELYINSYINSFVESEKGQCLMQKGMTSFFIKHCVAQLSDFQEENPLGMDWIPAMQINMLLQQCEMMSKVVDRPCDNNVLNVISDVVLRVFECCQHLKSYAHLYPCKSSALTEKVDQLIRVNKIEIDKMDIKSSHMTKEEFLSLEDEPISNISYSNKERAEVSILRKYGYSVGKDNAMSDSKRQELLNSLITKKLVTKGQVMSHLKYLIKINGNKITNSNAREKWIKDLEYIKEL